MKELEEAMYATIKDKFKISVEDYSIKDTRESDKKITFLSLLMKSKLNLTFIKIMS